MTTPVVYRPLRDEHNPNALHYGAISVENAMEHFNDGYDFPMDGDSIAVRSVRVVNLPPVGNRVAVYRLTRIDNAYNVYLGMDDAMKFASASEGLYDYLLDEME